MTDQRVLDELLFDACVGCGCRDDHACAEGCAWEIPYLLCSACAEDLDAAIAGWADRAADAIARLVWWRRGGQSDAPHGGDLVEASLREAILAIALPDRPILPIPEPEGGSTDPATTSRSSDPTQSAGREPRERGPRPAPSAETAP